MLVEQEKDSQADLQKEKMNAPQKEQALEVQTGPSLRRRQIYVGIFWLLILLIIYLLLSISSGYAVWVSIATFFYYIYTIDNYTLKIIPYQDRLKAWFCRSLIYDIFFRGLKGNKNLLATRAFALMSFLTFLFLQMMVFHRPNIDLEQMVVTHGTLQTVKKMGRKNPCGTGELTFIQQDGTLFTGRIFLYGDDFQTLAKYKGEPFTLWLEPQDSHLLPECRKTILINQLTGKDYKDHLYHKEYREKTNRGLQVLAVFFFIVTGLFSLPLFLTRKKRKMMYLAQTQTEQ